MMRVIAGEELVQTVEFGDRRSVRRARGRGSCSRRLRALLTTSLAMNDDHPPLSAAEASHSTSKGSTSTELPWKSVTSTPDGSDGDDLVLADRERIAGVLDEGGDVRSEEVLALAETDHERGVAASADDESRVLFVHREQVKAPSRRAATRGRPRPGHRRSLVFAAEQDGRHLGVGLAAERVALAEELGLQLGEVLDDAVVDDGELVVIGQVRVRVRVGRAAVRRPPGVTDAGRAVLHGVGEQVVAQHLELAGALAHLEVAVGVDHGDAGGVVAAKLEPREAGQQNRLARAGSHVSDDSTHGVNPTGAGWAQPERARHEVTDASGRASRVTASRARPSRPRGRRPSAESVSRGGASGGRSLRGWAG